MMNQLNKKISSLNYIMILGQKLKNAALQLGNKSIGAIHTLGSKMGPIVNTVGSAINTAHKVKEIYSNLEKLVPRRLK